MELWIGLTLASAIAFAFKDILAKRCFSKLDITPKQLVFEQYLFSFSAILLIAFPFIEFDLFYSNAFLFLAKGTSLATSTLLYFSMLKKYEISLVSPLLNLSPLSLLVLSVFILSESISFLNILGILVIIFATYILEVNHNHHEKKDPHKFHFRELLKTPSTFFIYAAGMILSISFAAIFDKMIFNQGVNTFTNLYFSALIIATFVFLFLAKEGKIKQTITKVITQPQTLLISLVGFIDQMLILTAIAMPQALISLVIPLRRTSTLFASIFGGILFHEKHMLRKFLATLIMLFGIFLIVF